MSGPAPPLSSSILDRIGRTPLVRLGRLVEPGMAEVFVKCEHLNPGGSIKDRAALAMIEAAEAEGVLKPGATIVEATSGNTGIGLALVAAVKGYRLILTMPDNMSRERQSLLRAYGAELHLTPALGVMRAAVDAAAALLERTPGAFNPQQFRNPANPAAHFTGTGPELLSQLNGSAPDVFIAGIGTGGTITGVGRALRQARAGVRLIGIEPANSAVLGGGRPGPHRIQGIGAGFIPDNLDRSLLNEVRPVTEGDAERMQRLLAQKEGLLAGVSSGANVKVALDVARALGPGHTVVTVLCDTGERSLSH